MVLVVLRRPQKLLDVLGDLLRLADDVLGAGQAQVGLGLRGRVQLRDGGGVSRAAPAPQTAPPAQTAGGVRANITPVYSGTRLGNVLISSHLRSDVKTQA